MLTVLLSLALAAPPLRLADLLREAREKNPDLKAATARVRAAQSSISPAGALDDPMLMVQLWNGPVDFSTVPIMVQLSQNIPLGGKRGARTDMARADAAQIRALVAANRRPDDRRSALAVDADPDEGQDPVERRLVVLDRDVSIGRRDAEPRTGDHVLVVLGHEG